MKKISMNFDNSNMNNYLNANNSSSINSMIYSGNGGSVENISIDDVEVIEFDINNSSEEINVDAFDNFLTGVVETLVYYEELYELYGNTYYCGFINDMSAGVYRDSSGNTIYVDYTLSNGKYLCRINGTVLTPDEIIGRLNYEKYDDIFDSYAAVYFIEWAVDNGYSTDKIKKDKNTFIKCRDEFFEYIRGEYTDCYNECFRNWVKSKYGVEIELTHQECWDKAEEYAGIVSYLDISCYDLKQKRKELPYIEIMNSDDFIHYTDSNRNNFLNNISSSEVKSVYLNFLEEDEQKLCRYLYDTEGIDAVTNYLDAIEDKINQRKGKKEADDFLADITDESGDIDYNAWTVLRTSGEGILDGIGNFFEGIANLSETEGMISANQYAQMYIIQYLTNTSGTYIEKLYQEVFDKNGEEAANEFLTSITDENGELDLEKAKVVLTNEQYSKLVSKIKNDKYAYLDDIYQLGIGLGNMLPTICMTKLLSTIPVLAPAAEYIGNFLMGLSAAGNAKNQALISGSSLSTATIYAICVGSSEMCFGQLLGNIPGLNSNASLTLKGIFKEGLEEGLQEYIEAGLGAVLLGEEIDLGELTGDALKSFVYGCILSGELNICSAGIKVLVNGVKVTMNYVDFINFLTILKKSGVLTENGINNNVENIYVNENTSNLTKMIDMIGSIYKNANIWVVGNNNNNILSKAKSISKSISALYMYGSPLNGTFGCDQGGIMEGNQYVLNGIIYDYLEAMKIYNNAVKYGLQIPHFTVRETSNFQYLRQKLIDQGFSYQDATVILYSVDIFGACTYATKVNMIFSYFLRERTETDFYNTFGFSMFTIDDNGNKILNTNELLLDLYIYANSVSNNGYMISDYNNTLNVYAFDNNQFTPESFKVLNGGFQEVMSLASGSNQNLFNSYLRSKGLECVVKYEYSSINSRLSPTDAIFYNNISTAIREFNIGSFVELCIFDVNNDVIHLNSEQPNYYPSDSTARYNGGGHSVFVTGIDGNNFYVSSYGREYSIPFSDFKKSKGYLLSISEIRTQIQ